MPLRHVAMYRWAPHVDDAHLERVREAFDGLAALFPEVRRHEHGSDVGVSEGTFDYVVVADFESVVDWCAYRDHPAHLLLVAELIDGHVLEQAASHYRVHDAHGVSTVRSHHGADDDTGAPADESDDELLARARRAAMAEMQALLAEPDDPI